MKIIQVGKQFTSDQVNLNRIDPEELVLMVDVDRCIACGACELACQAEHGREPAMDGVRRPLETGAKGTAGLNLPGSCRHCAQPCEYFSDYNFWATCPVSRTRPSYQTEACDGCASRLEKGFMPACATRCSMKCIYFGRAADVAFTLAEKKLRSMGDIELGA